MTLVTYGRLLAAVLIFTLARTARAACPPDDPAKECSRDHLELCTDCQIAKFRAEDKAKNSKSVQSARAAYQTALAKKRAAAPDRLAAATQEADDAKANLDKTQKDETDSSLSSQLQALHFGLGLGVTMLGHQEIVSAELDGTNSLVRITDQQKERLGVWLGLDYAFTELNPDGHAGWGAFVGVQLASSAGDTIASLAFGPAFLWKFTTWCDKNDKTGLTIGVGAVNTKIQVLGAGVTPGQPLPPGEQNIRYEKKSLWGGAIVFGFNVL